MKMSAEAGARVLFGAALVAVALGAGAWYWFGAWQHNTYEIRTRESVSGLIAGAPVEFHGVEVGKIREVRLADPRSVSILVDLRKGTPVTPATRATITGRGLATRGFTGYVYISLDDLDAPAAAPLTVADGGYPQIAVSPSQSVSLDTSINQLNANVQTVTALLTSVLDPATVRSLQESLAGLNLMTKTLAANNGKLAAMIANAERASAQLPPLLQASQATLNTLQTQVVPQAQGTLLKMDKLTTDVNDRLGVILLRSEQASAQIGPLLEASNATVRSLQFQVLPEAERTLMRLDRLSGSLDETTSRIRRNPSLLLRGTAALPGPGETP